ncbi:YSIRK-type signal peptide-containing protein, partial [Ligilactobacillus agilis]|uniref:YSIRK-type signal peptide-containing protein n=1 Tax=Ligilactobacillus agilis TaxID=1601 RepID=UPI00117B5C01
MIRRKSNGNREKQRFSIKKISGKTASVLIGFTIFGGLLIESPKVKADTNTSYNSVEKTTSDTNTSENGGKADVNSTQTDSTASTVTPVGSTADKATTNTSEANSTSQINSTNQADSVASLSTSTNSEVGSEAVTTSQASSETTVTSEVTSTAPTTAPTNSAPVRVRRAVTTNLATANYEDRDSGTVNNPTMVGADGISKVQIGGTAPNVSSSSSLVTMKIKFQSYQTPITVQSLPITIRGVEEGGNGVIVFNTGISNIDLTPQGVEYTVYIVSKSTNKPYLLKNDNVVLTRDGLDTNFVTYVKSKVTDENKMTSDIVIEVAESPQLTEEAKQGLVIRKSAINPLKARDYIANGESIPNYSKLLPSFKGLDTKTPGKQNVKIAVPYPGGSTSWTYGNNIDYNSETFTVEVTDADKLNDSIQTVAPTKSTDNYKFAEQDKKDAYDAAVKNATSVFSNQKSTQAEIDSAKQQLDNASAALNGNSNKSKAINDANKAIDAMTNLSDADKAAAKEAVTNAEDLGKLTDAVNNAQSLDTAKGEANKAIDAMPNLSDADKATAKEAVANATDEAGVTSAKEAAQSLDTAKGDANKAIDEMSNLSDTDKANAKEVVANATDEAGVTTAKDNAQSLDTAKGDA